MIVIEQSRLARLLLPKGYAAINLFGIVLTPRDELNRIQLAHEHIHTSQYREWFAIAFIILALLSAMHLAPWWLPFALSPFAYYTAYTTEFTLRYLYHAIRRRSLRVWKQAYYHVSYEAEAYQHQWDESYRLPFGWTWWLTK